MSLEREYHTRILGNAFLPSSLRTSGNSIQNRLIILYIKACMAKVGWYNLLLCHIMQHQWQMHCIFNTVNRGVLGHESVKRGRQFHTESWSNEFGKVYYIKISAY